MTGWWAFPNCNFDQKGFPQISSCLFMHFPFSNAKIVIRIQNADVYANQEVPIKQHCWCLLYSIVRCVISLFYLSSADVYFSESKRCFSLSFTQLSIFLFCRNYTKRKENNFLLTTHLILYAPLNF